VREIRDSSAAERVRAGVVGCCPLGVRPQLGTGGGYRSTKPRIAGEGVSVSNPLATTDGQPLLMVDRGWSAAAVIAHMRRQQRKRVTGGLDERCSSSLGADTLFRHARRPQSARHACQSLLASLGSGWHPQNGFLGDN
jgi:hypothetical protein